MTHLQELLLVNCNSLRQCLDLSNVVSLQQFDVVHCSELSQILDLHKLTKLQRLNLKLTKVTKLTGLNNSIPLLELCVSTSKIEELPNLHFLRHLRRLSMEDIRPTMMPLFDSFTTLEELILNDLPQIRDIHGMRSFTRLKKLTIRLVSNLLQLPHLGDLIALPNLHKLVNLENLGIIKTPIKKKLGLERLTQLRELRCSGTLLAKLPILNGLDNLEWIDFFECHELTSLEDVGTLPALTHLDISGCFSLMRLPDIRSSKNLGFLLIDHTKVSLGLEDIMALSTLPALLMWDWDWGRVLFPKVIRRDVIGGGCIAFGSKETEASHHIVGKDHLAGGVEMSLSSYPSHACYDTLMKYRPLAL